MNDQERQGDDAASRFAGEEHHGWSPDLDDDTGQAAEAGTKARQATGQADKAGGGRSPGATLTDTDMEPGSPFGSGDSSTRRGEEIGAEEGGDAEGHKGASQRPYGGADPSDATGVDPQGSRHPDSPDMPPG